MWKTGGPDTSEMATPKRVKISHPKDSDTIRFLVEDKYEQIKKANANFSLFLSMAEIRKRRGRFLFGFKMGGQQYAEETVSRIGQYFMEAWKKILTHKSSSRKYLLVKVRFTVEFFII